MLRWSQGKTRKDRIKNETTRGIAKVTSIKSVLTQTQLSWYGHMMRREDTHITSSPLRIKVTGTRPSGRSKMRWLDRLNIDMRISGINPEMATARERWSLMVEKRRHTLSGIGSADYWRRVYLKIFFLDIVNASTSARVDPIHRSSQLQIYTIYISMLFK